jgi:hypothetical protein
LAWRTTSSAISRSLMVDVDEDDLDAYRVVFERSLLDAFARK